MATINYAAREISVKIVYYGPGLSGKTTNLQIIHRKIPGGSKSDMVSLATETDRTLFFDFLPLDLGKIRGFTTKFQLYTVPGQVYYNATRKLVLRGVDGIVFVADSAADKLSENFESFKNMEDNLAEYGYKRETIPIIIQYNKRDLPNALPTRELDSKLNRYNLHWSEAISHKGIGVFESLKLIGKLVIDQLNQKYSSPSRKRMTKSASSPAQPSSPVPPVKKTPQPQAQPQPQPAQTPPPPIPSYNQAPAQHQMMANPNTVQNQFKPAPKPAQSNPTNYGNIDFEPMIQNSPSALPGNALPGNNRSIPNQPPRNSDNFYNPPSQPPATQGPLPPDQHFQPNARKNQYFQKGSAQPSSQTNSGEPVFEPKKNAEYKFNQHVSKGRMPNNPSFSPSPNSMAQTPNPPEVVDFSPPPTNLAPNQSATPSFENDSIDHDNISKPMFFTSVNKEKTKKKGKKPVNPKLKKQSIFTRLFRWGK